MEDGVVVDHEADARAEHAGRSPPPPPDPNADAAVAAVDAAPDNGPGDPIRLDGPGWDVTSISASGAMRMLAEALDMLAEATGDVPATPPISRPSTPRMGRAADGSRVSTERASLPAISIGSPEAHPHEPIRFVGDGAEEHIIQHAAIARRFFSKAPPPFSVAEYLERFHAHCPHSPGVYLAAASYCYRLCVADYMVLATKRTIHRLALATIRIAAKALEDSKWRQAWICGWGGINRMQLLNLEVSVCFLLDFELGVDGPRLARDMFALQQAARQGAGLRGKLSEFRLKLPVRHKASAVPAAA